MSLSSDGTEDNVEERNSDDDQTKGNVVKKIPLIRLKIKSQIFFKH